MKFTCRFIGFILFIGTTVAGAAQPTTLRLGILAFGTAAWEIEAMQQEKSATNAAFTVEVHPVANPEAGKIALQSGAVDLIVSDWIWVSRARANGKDFTFYPYATASGALVVPEDSPIRSLKDLAGKRLGIAGGELDKNWLLLQALAQRLEHLNLDRTVTKMFGAPPILNQQILNHRVDAVMTYWHYAARLEAKGYRQLLDGRDILKALGIDAVVPSLGYVFKCGWADAHKQTLVAFLEAARQARQRLCHIDSAWHDILPLTRTDDTKIQSLLRQRYCAGNIVSWGAKEQQAARRIYQLLKILSHNRLTGAADLQPETFWSLN